MPTTDKICDILTERGGIVILQIITANGVVEWMQIKSFIWLLVACWFPLSTMVHAQSETTDKPEGEEEAATSTGAESGTNQPAVKPLPRKHLLPETIEQAALADESIKKQLVWLDSPEGPEGAMRSFLGLELYEKTPLPQGAVLLLHGVEQHPDWPRVIKPLRTVLPDDGWYTLAIMLPYENHLAPPKRELATKSVASIELADDRPRLSGRLSKASTDSADGAVTEASDAPSDASPNETDSDAAEVTSRETIEGEPPAVDEAAAPASKEADIDISAGEPATATPSKLTFDEKVQLRLSAALSHITQRGYRNIVLIGYQQGAQSVLDYLVNNRATLPEKGLTVVWIDAVMDSDGGTSMGESLGKNLPLLMLDIVDSSVIAGGQGRQRAGEAKRQGYTGYSQVKLPIADNGRLQVSGLMQRIRGWLKVNAPGMQATKVKQ